MKGAVWEKHTHAEKQNATLTDTARFTAASTCVFVRVQVCTCLLYSTFGFFYRFL